MKLITRMALCTALVAPSLAYAADPAVCGHCVDPGARYYQTKSGYEANCAPCLTSPHIDPATKSQIRANFERANQTWPFYLAQRAIAANEGALTRIADLNGDIEGLLARIEGKTQFVEQRVHLEELRGRLTHLGEMLRAENAEAEELGRVEPATPEGRARMETFLDETRHQQEFESFGAEIRQIGDDVNERLAMTLSAAELFTDINGQIQIQIDNIKNKIERRLKVMKGDSNKKLRDDLNAYKKKLKKSHEKLIESVSGITVANLEHDELTRRIAEAENLQAKVNDIGREVVKIKHIYQVVQGIRPEEESVDVMEIPGAAAGMEPLSARPGGARPAASAAVAGEIEPIDYKAMISGPINAMSLEQKQDLAKNLRKVSKDKLKELVDGVAEMMHITRSKKMRLKNPYKDLKAEVEELNNRLDDLATGLEDVKSKLKDSGHSAETLRDTLKIAKDMDENVIPQYNDLWNRIKAKQVEKGGAADESTAVTEEPVVKKKRVKKPVTEVTAGAAAESTAVTEEPVVKKKRVRKPKAGTGAEPEPAASSAPLPVGEAAAGVGTGTGKGG